jgi:four helix bundle protein
MARLMIYDTALEMVRSVSAVARRVERSDPDPDLARQMRRACTSVPLNLAEGMHSQGRNRSARLYNSMGSAKETLACLDVSAAAGYVEEHEVAGERDRIDRIVATLYRLIHRR